MECSFPTTPCLGGVDVALDQHHLAGQTQLLHAGAGHVQQRVRQVAQVHRVTGSLTATTRTELLRSSLMIPVGRDVVDELSCHSSISASPLVALQGGY